MGDRGIAGAPGLTGPKGLKGQPGECIKGAPGNVGLPGQHGIDGQKGDNGNRGITGLPGDNKPISSLSLIQRLQITIDNVRDKISKCCSAFRSGRDINRTVRQTKLPICPLTAVAKREIVQLEELAHASRNPRQSYLSNCIYYQGPPGDRGVPGPRGDAGTRGYTGATGIKGARGPTGDKGSRGPQGPVGPKGTQGNNYNKFCPGTGQPGMKGDKGDRGSQGARGNTGPRGIPGDACASSYGPRGNDGEPGFQGKKGGKGQKGNPGPKGQKGNAALGDITEETYEKHLQMLQEIIETIDSGKCCTQNSCTHNGVAYQQGEQIKPNCTTKCTCQNGHWVCSRTQCFTGATCYASGDPHYGTFDGRRYNFQGICEYVLAKDCKTGRFTVTVVNTQCGRTVSCTTQVTVTVPNLNLVIVLKRGSSGGELYVNNIHHPKVGNGPILKIGEVEIVRSSGSLIVILTNIGLVVTWRGSSVVHVQASETLKNELCGLCGNYNGDKTDDFQNPSGVLEGNANDFGFSWLRDSQLTRSTCTLPPPDPCPSVIQSQGTSRCNALKAAQFSACHGVVSPEPYIADCIYDYCRCPSTQREMCYCDSLESYAKACAAKGIVLNKWRTLYCRKYTV